MLWKIAKPLLFQMDPEKAHRLTLHLLQKMPALAGRSPVTEHKLNIGGLRLTNPIGLAAGLDKNAEALLAWQNLGFGFAEVGTVTAVAQHGNPRPRLFRLPQHQALYNRMGFNNDGADLVAQRIEQQRKNSNIRIPIGINIGKSAIVPIEDASSDYCTSFEKLADVADYIAINVSSPNTKDLRSLQREDALSRILQGVGDRNQKRSFPLPIFVKIAPDLDEEQAITTCLAALQSGASGIIVSNTTTRDMNITVIPSGGGGLSGAPLFVPSTKLLEQLRKALGEKVVLIGSGGVMTAVDATKKLQSGANLVQIYSGLIYNGPELVRCCVRSSMTSRMA